MPKIIVIEIEVDDNDRGVVGEIASELSCYHIINIGFKKEDPKPTGPIYRNVAKDGGGLADATRQAVDSQL